VHFCYRLFLVSFAKLKLHKFASVCLLTPSHKLSFSMLQGRDKNDGSRSSRCDCPCVLSLLKAEDDAWYVKRFVAEHSHAMSVSCGEKRRWPSHSRIDGSTRELVRHLRSNNVQLSRVCSIVGTVHQSDSYVPFSRQSVRTMCAKLAQESIEGDM
jgi:hypothetical protein